MATQKQLDDCYMAVSYAHAKLSKAVRKKVGCCIVTSNGTVLGGCNGLAPNSGNVLEDKVYLDGGGAWMDEEEIYEQFPYVDDVDRYRLVTKPEVIHGELNCLLRAAREGVSVVGGILYTTLSCCVPCSEMIAASGIKRVVYDELYRDSKGVENLERLKIDVEKYENNT